MLDPTAIAKILLRRMEHREEEQIRPRREGSSNVMKPFSHHAQIVQQPNGGLQNQIPYTSNPQRVSATNISPFKVLSEVEVRRAR